MTVVAALPDRMTDAEGNILTFIVPSQDGCNLECPFCSIEQQYEQSAEPPLQATTLPDVANVESWPALLDRFPEILTVDVNFSLDVPTVAVVLVVGLLVARFWMR